MKIFAFSFTFVLAASFAVKAQDCEQAGSTMSAVRACIYDKLDKNLNSATNLCIRGSQQEMPPPRHF
jgi:uncharacterized protein YecT (DUF1311 family)